MMAARIDTETGPEPDIYRPEVLLEGTYYSDAFGNASGDVGPNGEGLLMVTSDTQALASQINVVFNWFEELKRLVPTGR